MKTYNFIPLPPRDHFSEEEMISRSGMFYRDLHTRRTVRMFSSKSVPRKVIENCLLTAGTAPSGANLQPWKFVVVTDQKIKQEIRTRAEAEEQKFYRERAPQEWLDALAPLGTDAEKPYLEIAPVLIAIFVQRYILSAGGKQIKNYYAVESVGIATGMLITALHHAGLSSLTHTPSPMGFLNEILGRPENERAFLLLVAGYPHQKAIVPDIGRKPLSEIASFL